MRFLVDECAGPSVARWLREREHDVVSIYHESRGIDDEAIVQRSFSEDRILITSDKGFGEKVYRERWPHRGVILLRLKDERIPSKIEALHHLIENHASRLSGQFIVVTERGVRFGP